MEEHLAERDYLATAHPTIADLACYSYVAHAPEGGISLKPYPAVRRRPVGRRELDIQNEGATANDQS